LFQLVSIWWGVAMCLVLIHSLAVNSSQAATLVV
jgi:hypothetical protein